jgi:hypothetical protein
MDGARDDQRGPHHGRRDDDGAADAQREAKRDAFAADIAARLRHVCQHLTDDAVALLVRDMAETKLRFAIIEATTWPVRRPAPPPADLDSVPPA